MWGTPTLVKIDDDRTDLVMCVAKELWGMNPDNGELRWFANATDSQQAYTSVLLDGKRVFAFTGRGGSIAIDAGGTGNVSESNTVWTGNDTTRFATPVRHKDKIYIVANGIVTSVDAKSGDRLQRLRLKGADKTGGRFGTLDYPSPIVVGDHMYYLNGSGQMFVFSLGDEMELESVNRVTADKEIFWGTPAVTNGQLLIRSSKHLYCVADKGEEVKADDNAQTGAEKMDPKEEVQDPRGSRRSFNPDDIFKRLDTDSDGSLSEAEISANPMAEQMKPMDTDGDKAISKEEFDKGMASMMSRRGSRGGSRGGASGGGRPSGAGGGRPGGSGRPGGYGQRAERPERPQRPKSAGQ